MHFSSQLTESHLFTGTPSASLLFEKLGYLPFLVSLIKSSGFSRNPFFSFGLVITVNSSYLKPIYAV